MSTPRSLRRIFFLIPISQVSKARPKLMHARLSLADAFLLFDFTHGTRSLGYPRFFISNSFLVISKKELGKCLWSSFSFVWSRWVEQDRVGYPSDWAPWLTELESSLPRWDCSHGARSYMNRVGTLTKWSFCLSKVHLGKRPGAITKHFRVVTAFSDH